MIGRLGSKVGMETTKDCGHGCRPAWIPAHLALRIEKSDTSLLPSDI